jgi:hypothetical protein
MSVTHHPVSYEETIRVEVDGAEPLTKQYGVALYRPTRADITYRWGADRSPQVVVTLHGPRVKKDGSHSAQWVEDYMGEGDGRYSPIWPEWLTAAADEYRPAGAK